MRRLGEEPAVARMASELGVGGGDDAVAAVTSYCRAKIDGWVRDANPQPASIRELEQLVCRKIRLVFEEVWSDEDLLSVIRRYVSVGEHVFATLKHDLDDETFATLLERQTATARCPDRYVAVIDCRGDKGARRFFTRWHEIAHLLTMTRQLELPFHRSRGQRDPLERLMDAVAGTVGFYDPLFSPALEEAVKRTRRLSFEVVEQVRKKVCPDASFRATLNACVSRLKTPALIVEARMGYKKHEREALESQQLTLLPAEKPTAELRVSVAGGNEAARRSALRVNKNMRVPEDSLLYKHFYLSSATTSSDQTTSEDLGIWCHSDGRSVGTGLIFVETRHCEDHVLALMQPGSPTRS
jgi:hypothetical protein